MISWWVGFLPKKTDGRINNKEGLDTPRVQLEKKRRLLGVHASVSRLFFNILKHFCLGFRGCSVPWTSWTDPNENMFFFYTSILENLPQYHVLKMLKKVERKTGVWFSLGGDDFQVPASGRSLRSYLEMRRPAAFFAYGRCGRGYLAVLSSDSSAHSDCATRPVRLFLIDWRLLDKVRRLPHVTAWGRVLLPKHRFEFGLHTLFLQLFPSGPRFFSVSKACSAAAGRSEEYQSLREAGRNHGGREASLETPLGWKEKIAKFHIELAPKRNHPELLNWTGLFSFQPSFLRGENPWFQGNTVNFQLEKWKLHNPAIPETIFWLFFSQKRPFYPLFY